jgi:hypothetical protein
MHFSWKHLLILVVLVVAIILAVFFWQAMTIRSESEYHEYHYDVMVSTPAILSNCTFLLPVPSVRNRSLLGESLVRGEGHSVPAEWGLSLEQVKGTPMLRISAPSIVPEYHGYPIPIEPGGIPVETPPPVRTAYSDETPVLIPLDFGVSLKVPGSIDTREPIGREPLLASPDLLAPAPCRWPYGSGQCYRYPARIFVSCSPGGGGNLTLSISGGGTNQWWMGGWSGNSYDENVELIMEDSRKGWVTGDGFLTTGFGSYS